MGDGMPRRELSLAERVEFLKSHKKGIVVGSARDAARRAEEEVLGWALDRGLAPPSVNPDRAERAARRYARAMVRLRKLGYEGKP